LFVKALLGVMAKDSTHAAIIPPWPARFAHHLQDIRDRVIHIAMLMPIEMLRAHDDDEMRGDRSHPPTLRVCRYHHLNRSRQEQLFHNLPLGIAHPLMEECDAE